MWENWLVWCVLRLGTLAIDVWWLVDPYEDGRWVWNWLRLLFWIILIAVVVYFLVALLR
jgi:hypothetical protein